MAFQTPEIPAVVVFDYGNVIAVPPQAPTVAAMAQLCGLPQTDFDQRYWRFRADYDQGFLDDDGYWGAICASPPAYSAAPVSRTTPTSSTTPTSTTTRALTAATIDALVELDIFAWSTLNIAAVEWLLSLHRAGQRVALLSNMPATLALRYEALFDWLDVFEVRLFSAQVGINKPDPRIYGLLSERLNCPPQQLLFIDDIERNVAGARAVGMHSEVYHARSGWSGLEAIAAAYRLPAPPPRKELTWQTV